MLFLKFLLVFHSLQAFYNIFLYFQSQFLTRLCLIVCYVQQSGLSYLNKESVQLQTNLRTHTKQLGIWLNENVRPKKKPDENWQRKHAKSDAVVSTDIVKIKRSSMDVLCRLIAIVNQYQNTDDQIQLLNEHTNKQHLMEILNEMQRVNESLCACQEDFETLKLIYTKCLTKTNDLPIDVEQNQIQNESASTVDDLKPPLDPNDKNPNLDDENREYFAMRDIKNDEDSDSDDENQNARSTKIKWYDELDNIDVKVTRSFFAPVLKQLKTKIDPIKEEMKEREMKYLLSKGIDREKIIEFDKNVDTPDQGSHTSDSDGSDSDSQNGDHNKAKTKQPTNRYNEMRAFLEQKQQIQFLPLGCNLPPLSGSEDVIE